MNIRKIFKKILYFYFNYHDYDVPTLLTSTSFIRHVQFAFRMTISFLIGGFLAYETRLNNSSRLQYIVPVTSILTIQETFGMTLIGACYMIIIIIPLSIFLFIIQKIGLDYHDYLAAELTLLISSLLISYKYSQIQMRKIPLLINAIFFATIVNQESVPSTFSFLILLKFIIGLIIPIIVSLFICPLFATIDFENRINYCLKTLQEMQTIVIQAFICQDEMNAKLEITRASILERIIRRTMNLLPKRLIESRMEPSKLLQQIYNRKRKYLFALTLQEQEDFICSLMFHISSMQMMVERCHFNEYHAHLIQGLQKDLRYFITCQSAIVSSLLSQRIIDRNEFDHRLNELEHALEIIHNAYIAIRVATVENTLELGINIRSEDHLSHAFFLFQIGAIVRLLKNATTIRENTNIYQDLKNAWKKQRNKKRTSWKDLLKLQWPRFLSALKSMIIIGVGSIFIMVPRLARILENGQWILIVLCLAQGDTIDGVFTTMKMRLVGTLLGSMWSYVIYLVADTHIYRIFGMLIPWLLIFGYLKSSSKWDYAAVMAAWIPAMINLGRLPYNDALPSGDFAILRIEETLVGIALAVILTIIIFPVFAIDLLRNNVQTTLQLCRVTGDSMRSIYKHLFHHESLNISTNNDIEENDTSKIESVVSVQRSRFHRLIQTQQILLEHVSIEPAICWSRNKFTPELYSKLILQQIDIFQMLHNIDTIFIHMSEITNGDANQIKNLQMQTSNGLLMPDLYSELIDVCRQLNDCLNLWSSYFSLTQTRFYQLSHDCTFNPMKFTRENLFKHEQCLLELHETNYRLRIQQQQAVNLLLDHYLDRVITGESLSNFVTYAENEKIDALLMGISAVHYSIAQLVRATLTLGINIHSIFELETTYLYRPF